MLLLPEYMRRLGSTDRFHVGFAERGLKNWAKKPANTAQKRGDGVFEGQCAAHIRERSMIDHVLTQMDSEEEDIFDEDDPIDDDMEVGGSYFHIRVERDTDNPRRKQVLISIRFCGIPGIPQNLEYGTETQFNFNL
jgi:hypothetical protein